MKRIVIALSALLLVALLFIHSCKDRQPKDKSFKPIRSTHFASDRLADKLFHKDQIIIFYKHAPSPAEIASIREKIVAAGITDSISVRKCNSCSGYAELWSADSIHTVIHTEGIVGGSGRGGSHGVGEDTIANYSLNFLVRPPLENKDLQSDKEILRQSRGDKMDPNGASKDTIIVAVLDTGIDTVNIVDPAFIWKNKRERAGVADLDGNCYNGDIKGWNFVSGSSDITEDNVNLHGSLVARYILTALGDQSKNFVQIMPLKTHDNTGYGDLFNTICALHYAIDEGANVINASWGFYFYDEEPHAYLTQLITRKLAEKGILFITASGNRMEEADAYAKALYLTTHGVEIPDTLLRNLGFHRFYPACLSDSVNNVLTVTTNDQSNVSPTQNFSSRFVNSGVLADTMFSGMMKFRLPFRNATGFVSGSSFATAIFTGRLAANLPLSQLAPGVRKTEVLRWLEENSAANSIPVTIVHEPVLASRRRIDDGRYLK
jgi:hypothetical protein